MYRAIAARTSAKRTRRRGLSIGTFETTATSAVAVLLVAVGSELVLATLAEFVTRPVVDGAVTINVIVAVPAAERLPIVHMTVAVPTHVPWLGVTDTNVVPAGIESDTLIPVAVAGPLLRAVMV